MPRKSDRDTVVHCAEKLEHTLGIPKKYMEGLIYDVDFHAQNFPNAYQYVPESTHFTLTYKNKSWRVSNIRRDTCRRKGHEFVCQNMPNEAAEAILRSKAVF